MTANSVWFVLAGLAACADPSAPRGVMSGTIKGQTFEIVDAVSVSFDTPNIKDQPSTAAYVFLGTTPNFCSDLKGNIARKGEMILSLLFADVHTTNDSTPTMPGTYTIGDYAIDPDSRPPRAAAAGATLLDANCNRIFDIGATAGTIELTSVAEDKFDGTFDATLDNGDHITGNFSPEPCPEIAGELLGNAPQEQCRDSGPARPRE
jgi:hypothetical protein